MHAVPRPVESPRVTLLLPFRLAGETTVTLFGAVDVHGPSTERLDVELAKALCLDCPVRTECLAGALERREPWGVWGGQLFLQGVVIPRKRPRGRPRKNDVAA